MPPLAGPPQLPPTLAERFEVVAKTRPLRGGEAWVWRVTDRKRHGLLRPEFALKVYHRGAHPRPEVLKRRTAMKSPHLLKLQNSDVAGGQPWELRVDGQSWELTDWVAGGTLHDLVSRHPDGMPEPLIHAIVEQLADALRAVHRAKVVHRDVKPANILIKKDGGPDEIKVVLVDFGAACEVDRTIAFRSNLPLTREYSAPEIFGDAFTVKSDWWSVGVTVDEMATGRHPLAGYSEEQIPYRIIQNTMPIPEEGKASASLRLLCRGLLVNRDTDRWGGDELADWLDDKLPPVPDERGPGVSTKAAFVFDGTPHYDRASLASALAVERNWGKAARDLFAGGRWQELRGWLEQFHDPGATDSPEQLDGRLRRVSSSPDASLLLVLRYMDPGLRATYQGYRISVAELGGIASDAAGEQPANDQAVAAKILDDLWSYHLLPHLDDAPGGAGLRDIDSRWRASKAAWDVARNRVNGRLPVAQHRQVEQQVWARWRETRLLAWLLGMAADPAMREEPRKRLTDRLKIIRVNLGGERLDWFEELAAAASTSPEASLAAYVVSALAVGESERVKAIRTAQRVSERERTRLWNSRENWRSLNRPVALGWAAAAVGIVAVGWVALLLFSSGVRFASAAEINEAWIFMTIALILQAGIELWLAAVIGGPYHPYYSLISELAPRAGRTGRAFQHRGTVGALVVAGVFAALLGATITVPFLLPLILVPAHAGWAYARHHRWQQDYKRRRNRVLGAMADDDAVRRPRTGWWQWMNRNRTEASA